MMQTAMIATIPIAIAYPSPGLWRTSPLIWAPMRSVTSGTWPLVS